MENSRILIIDDDRELCILIKKSVENEGIEADFCGTGREGMEMLECREYHLIILDVMMPGMDGFETLKKIRQKSKVPVLMFTSKNDNYSKVRGLREGADDYLTKPYDLEVFMARVEARLRAAHPKERAVRLGPLRMNLLSGRAYIGETDLNLTQKEFAALLYLARHPNRSVSAQELYEAVWQQPMGDDPHAVRMTISRLKQKLGGEDARVTVNSYRSSGYRLEEQ